MQQQKKNNLQAQSIKNIETPSLLTANKARESLKNLNGWQLTDDCKMIYREFILKDFMAAIGLIDSIAPIAQDEQHHPDIHLTQYRNLRVGLKTHDIGGLSDKDFTVATKINAIMNPSEKIEQAVKKSSKIESKPTTIEKKNKPMPKHPKSLAPKKNIKKAPRI